MKNRISEQPSISLLKSQVEQLESLANTNEDKLRVRELKGKVDEFSSLSDQFNDRFSTRGWIAYESLNVNTIKRAIHLFKSNGINKAEEYLVDYYDKGVVEVGIRFLWSVEPFRDRLRIIKLAYEDYISGRYYASIPLLLMMIDGVLADTNENAGFFSEKSDVTSWDSIAGHETGLKFIKEIFYKSRSKTNKSKISLPYRNGILHGRDLGYANREVAAKCWSLLFAVRDLLAAKRDEEERKMKFEKEKGKTIFDTQKEMIELQDKLAEVLSMDDFRRKPVIANVDYPISGPEESYLLNSPERTVIEFLNLWERNNYGHMASYIYRNPQITQKQIAGKINSTFKNKLIDSFSIIESNDLSSCKVDVTIKLTITYKEESRNHELRFRLLYCDINSTELVVNPKKSGKWKIVEDFSIVEQVGTSFEWLDDLIE